MGAWGSGMGERRAYKAKPMEILAQSCRDLYKQHRFHLGVVLIGVERGDAVCLLLILSLID